MTARGSAQEIGSPWVAIWVSPRATIRRIVDIDPRHRVVFLATLAGALSGLETQWAAPPAAGGALWPLLVVVTVMGGGLLGVLGLYINGALLKWAGALLGGSATCAEVRAALAWAEAPAITAMAIGIAAILLGGGAPPPAFGQPSRMWPPAGIAAIHAALALWSFMITLKCLGEVHRFSAWRALASLGMVLLAIVALVLGVFGAQQLLHPAVTV